MLGESAATAEGAEPTLAMRAALDLVAIEAGIRTGVLRARVLGSPRLVTALAEYAPIVEDGGLLVALEGATDEVRAAVVADKPERVVTVADGGLARRRGALPGGGTLAGDLPAAGWRTLGYRPVGRWGLQGPGSLLWAVAERLLRSVGRPEGADRCKIGMLRGLVASGPTAPLATVVVRSYRRLG